VRIILTGTYNSANKGDAAMQLGALQEIRARYPASVVEVLSPFPELDAPFYAPVPVVRCNRRNLFAATLDLALGLVWRWLPPRARPDWLLRGPMRRVRDCDLVIDLSGDMLTDEHGPHVAYSHYVPLLRAMVLRRPFLLCAQSIGPFRLTRALARRVLGQAARITVRDAISQANVAGLGVAASRVEKTADMAFLMAPASRERAAEILRDEGVESRGRALLGISVSRLVERSFDARDAQAGSSSFVETIAAAIGRVARAQRAGVVFVPHVTGPARSKDDRLISAEVKRRLAAEIPSTVLMGAYRPEELKAIIAACDVFCGARMHANIAALSSCVPTVAMAYSHKTPGIMAELGMEAFVIPAASLTVEALDDALSRAFRDRDAIRATLAGRMGPVRERAGRNLQDLPRLVDSARGDA
jgi:colanic acid/amylovoran biosynthesis protein